jgi:hypothetical protein
MKKNTDAVVVASKEIGLEVSTDNTKYMVMSRDLNAERSHKIKTDNSSFESSNQFKYFGKTQTNQNFIQEEMEGRMKSGNAYCHSLQNLSTSSLLPKILV